MRPEAYGGSAEAFGNAVLSYHVDYTAFRDGTSPVGLGREVFLTATLLLKPLSRRSRRIR